MRKTLGINLLSPHACKHMHKFQFTHTCTTHTCTLAYTHICVYHILTYRKGKCIRRKKCLAFENMEHSSWITVFSFKSIFVSRPLHPGDTTRKISSKLIRSTNIPVTCGHWTIIANRSCLPQQVSRTPESSAPKPVHFRLHICSSFL